MIIESIKLTIVVFILGLLSGGYIVKRYFDKKNHQLGSTIESILISGKIDEINALTQKLNEVVSKLNLRGEELIEKTQRSQDIEKPIDLKNYELDEMESIDISKYK